MLRDTMLRLTPAGPRATRATRAVLAAALLTTTTLSGIGLEAAPRAGGSPAGSIQAAIDKGRKSLLPRLAQQVANTPGSYPMGYIALSLAAVLKAGASSDHPVVKQALEKLETLPLQKTYSVACYLFALDAYWQGRYRESLEAQRKASAGKTVVGTPVPNIPPPGPIRKKMEELVAWLVRGGGGTWDYGGRKGGDHSNTQFAVLGLEIGIENDIDVPVAVQMAIAKHFLSTHVQGGDSEEFTIVFKTPSWEGVTTGVMRRTRFVAYPGGWGYRGAESVRDTMTAAGVSSLMVARKALKKAGAYNGQLAWEVDRKIESGLAWMAKNWGSYLRAHNHVYYGLYSVEKVGDIGSIVSLGPVNWYQEGAKFIVAKQQGDGSWGDEADSALALLFLTRATRSHLQTLGPPVLFTKVDGGDEEGSDLVYVEKLKGFVSATAIFDFLSETRDPKLLHMASDAIQAYPPHRTHEILARVVGLWTDQKDAVTRFAAEAAAGLTGVKSKERAHYEKLVDGFRRMRQWERTGEADPGAVVQLLRRAVSSRLKRRALDFIDRLGLADAFGAVIDRLVDPDPEVRRRAHEVLVQWTGESHPAPETAGKTGARLQAALDEAALPWREWWAKRGDGFRIQRRATLLIGRLAETEARDSAQVEQIVESLVRLGKGAAPAILEAMESDVYDVRLVKALEEITGQSRGLRARDWRKTVDALSE